MSDAPNILFLLSDEHSFRFMGQRTRDRGGEEVATPCLDRLGRQAAVFDGTYCPVPLCVPSRIALMTGLEAQRCGAINNYSILDPTLDTLPKMLGRAGYETALIGKMHFGGSLQFHGFKHRPYGDLMGVATHQYEDDLWNPEVGRGAQRDNGLNAEPNIGDNIIARTTIAGRTRICRIPDLRPHHRGGDRRISQEPHRRTAIQTLACLRLLQPTPLSPDGTAAVCRSLSDGDHL